MAYILKSSKDFKENINSYLEQNPIISYEESIINDFSSSCLSDLYKLFLDLEGSTLSPTTYQKLRNILEKNFSIPADSIFDELDKTGVISISSRHIHILELAIRDTFLKTLTNPSDIIDEKEFYQLSLIVNKIFPELFLGLIKNNNSNITKQQQFIKDKILSTIEHANLHNSQEAEEENRDIAASLYIVAKKLYPEIDIYIPIRIKSGKSSISNINKETFNTLQSLMPSNISEGLSQKDIEEQFNLQKANTDFSGFTIVVSNTDDTLHFDLNDPKSNELLKIRKVRNNNISFTHSLENFLLEKEDSYLSNLDLLQIKINLLMRLRESTYEECIREYQNTSFSSLLKETISRYEQEMNNPIAIQIADDELAYITQMNEIYQLLDELKSRVHDKYQAKLLDIILPNIFKDELISDTLKVSCNHIKNIKKKNGFCARYDSLITPGGRIIELQSLSKYRFQASKDGPSDHSSLANKEIDITQFFEPTDSSCDPEQFTYFLNILNHTPLATKNKLFFTPDTELSPTDRRIKRKIRTAKENIKLKKHYKFENILSDGSIQSSQYSLATYLPIFAEYVSPKSMSISSSHTRFNKSVAGYHKKSLLSSFRGVLLKHDSTSCLAQILIDELEELMQDTDKNEVSLNGINRRVKQRHANSDFPDSER